MQIYCSIYTYYDVPALRGNVTCLIPLEENNCAFSTFGLDFIFKFCLSPELYENWDTVLYIDLESFSILPGGTVTENKCHFLLVIKAFLFCNLLFFSR